MDILVRQLHRLRSTLVELALERSCEERGQRQNILVTGKEPCVATHNQGDYGAGQGTMVKMNCQPPMRPTVFRLDHGALTCPTADYPYFAASSTSYSCDTTSCST